LTRDLLWVDSRAGLLAGAGMFALSGWLCDWYRLPRTLLLGMGAANVCYGLFSAWLHARQHRAPPAIVALVIANAVWVGVCLFTAWRYRSAASLLGIAHLVGEAGIVASLAIMEWRARDVLRERR
jgi:hypothetical protein